MISDSRLFAEVAVASVVGRGHLAEGRGCDDCARASRGRRFSAVVLADGAGSASHSALGADVVTRSMLKSLRRQFHRLPGMPADAVAARLMRPVREALAHAANRLGVPLQALASTLLFAATDGHWCFIGQIGDGRIACLGADDVLHTPLQPVRGEHANETEFVTQRDPARRLQLARFRASEVRAVLLMTDGAETALFQQSAGTYAPAVKALLDWLPGKPRRVAGQVLGNNLRDVLSQKTQDDLSLGWLGLNHHG